MTNASIQYYAGIDLHKKYSYITVLDNEENIIIQDKFHNDKYTLQKALLQLNTPIRAAVESTFNSNWLVNTLEQVGINTLVIHPTKFKAIADSKVKTDKIDSYKIASNLKLNKLPLSYVSTPSELKSKDIVRIRFDLVSQRSRLKTKLKFVLLRNCINEFPYTDIAGQKSQKWLQTLKLESHEKEMINSYLNLINNLNEEIKQYNITINELSDMNTKAKLLTSIPGIGKLLGLTLVSEIGNIERFPSSKHLRSYSGLSPSTYSSGGKTTHGGITKQGSKLIRYSLSEAINHTIKKNKHLKEFYEVKTKEKGKSKAKVACMAKLLNYVYIMLKHNISYDQLNVART